MSELTQGIYVLISIWVAQQTMSWFMIPTIQRMLSSDSGSSRTTVAGVWTSLKVFVCAGSGMFLLSLSVLNPSLSLVLALPMIPLLIMVKPSDSFIKTVLQTLLVVLVSPPSIVSLACFLWGTNHVVSFLDYSVQSYHIFRGAIFLPLTVLVYWPLNLAMQLIITMQS
jgi:hypothetical protein